MKDNIFQNQLAESFKKYKDNTALLHGDRRMSYGDLDKYSAAVAGWLLKKGLKKETFIGLLANHRFRFLMGLIGISRAGCAFVPLDTVNPEGRLENMIDAAGLELILMTREDYDRYGQRDFTRNRGIEIAIIEDIADDAANLYDDEEKPEVDFSPSDRLYVYFTSGSTGVPKGVVGKNASLLHYCRWEIKTFNIDEGCRVGQFAAAGFDAFLKEAFVTLLSGATLCFPKHKDVIVDSEALSQWVEDCELHIIHCVPGVFRLLNRGGLTGAHFASLKYILLSGEPLFPAELKKWYDIFGERIQLVNLYGTTETTILSSYYLIREDDAKRKRIPIGKPIDGTRMIVLDKNKKYAKRRWWGRYISGHPIEPMAI